MNEFPVAFLVKLPVGSVFTFFPDELPQPVKWEHFETKGTWIQDWCLNANSQTGDVPDGCAG